MQSMVETASRTDTRAPPTPLALNGLSNLLGFHVRLAQAAIYRDFAASLSELDLTQRQFAVLQIIDANPGVSQVDIAALLGTDRATMMAIVDRLQDRGLAERRRSTGDRRRQELHTTPEGRALVARAVRIIAAHEKTFTDRFTPEELSFLFEALRRLHGAV